MGHGLGADAGLVGKRRPPDAGDDHRAQHAAGGGLAGEGVAHDQGERRPHLVRVQHQHHRGEQHVTGHHGRHQNSGDPADARQLARHHREHHGGQQQPEQQVEQEVVVGAGPAGGYGDRLADDFGELVDLKNRHGAEQAGEREKVRQRPPARAERLADNVHGAALKLALAVPAPVHHRQGAGVELGGDAEQRAHPHPEDGAGAAHRDGHRHAGHIAHAQGAGQGGAQRLEMRQRALVLAVRRAEQQPHAVRQMPVRQQPGIEQEEEAPADQQGDQWRAPQKPHQGPQGGVQSFEEVIHGESD